MNDDLDQLLKSLRLKRIAQILDGELTKAEKDETPFPKLLARLLRAEWQHRQDSALAWRIKSAGLPENWTLESFPFKKQPGVSQRQIRTFAELEFIPKAENIVFVGPTGVGKTGLASSLLLKALQNGNRGAFVKAQELFDEMYSSLADRSTRKLIKYLANLDVLVIDEMGYLNLKPEQTNIFFKLMEERYRRRSTIITTNLEYEEWHNFLGNNIAYPAGGRTGDNCLLATKVTTPEDLDQKREALDVANAQVTEALEMVYQARAALGLPGKPPEGTGVTDVPANLDQTFSSVRQALGELMQSAAQLGVVPSSYDLTPRQVVDEFYRRDPGGDINRIYAEIIKNAPALKQAQAGLEQAQRDLDQAKLELSYCAITAEIDGVITRRNVNPGNNVQVGQSLMAIRSLRDIWVDANFKETQLRDLRIGQRVNLEVDMYGGKQSFAGRISGFTMGTGSTLALLPPQNATGNFVKVVQRLPVRIDLINYDPNKLPLFVGLSVRPSVDIKSKPTGSNAGNFLQQLTSPAPAVSPAAAGR
jgi:multidrug resistance efflux pump